MKTVKNKYEKRNQWLLFFAFILFFAITYKCTAQQIRFATSKDTCINVISIEICNEGSDYRLIAQYPLNRSYNVRIGFENGDIEYLPMLADGQYYIPKRVFNKLKTMEFETIYFDGENPLVCRSIKTKRYFIEMLN